MPLLRHIYALTDVIEMPLPLSMLPMAFIHWLATLLPLMAD